MKLLKSMLSIALVLMVTLTSTAYASTTPAKPPVGDGATTLSDYPPGGEM